MKRIIIYILFTIILIAFPVTVYAADNKNASDVFITVVIPQTEPKKETPPPITASKPTINYLYPVNIFESQDNGRREIVKTYELAVNENPQNISRESFTHDGWLYELADITKAETSNSYMREHTETVTIETATNNVSAILQQLKSEMEHKSNDGYTGVLSLDISSIKVETAGTKSSSYTISAKREYPHLSSNDTSFIPKTITENGRTLTLSNIDWRVQNYTAVDNEQIPDSYTAVVSYTGTASKTTVTGYIATAEYRGQISKIITGKTIYKAYFIGIPIIAPTVDEPEITEPAVMKTTDFTIQDLPTETTFTEIELTSETDQFTEIETETEAVQETEPKCGPYNPLLIIILVLETVGFCGFIVYIIIKKNKNIKGDK